MQALTVNDQINSLISEAQKDKESSRRIANAFNDILWNNIMVFGYTDINKLETYQKVYYGYAKELIKLFDIATIDRQVLKYDYKRKMKRISNTITKDNEDYINKKTMELFMLSNSRSIKMNLPLYLKFLAHAFGLNNYEILDNKITNEMKEKWFSCNLGYIFINPGNYLTRLFDFDYFGVGFNTFMNSNKYQCLRLLVKNNFFDLDEDLKLAILLECYIYAPYLYEVIINHK